MSNTSITVRLTTVTVVRSSDTITLVQRPSTVVTSSTPVGPAGPIGPTGATGPTGPQGTSLARECRSDWDSTNKRSYIGVAAQGSSESASVWKVKRITVSGTTVTTATASPIKWSDRLTASYT